MSKSLKPQSSVAVHAFLRHLSTLYEEVTTSTPDGSLTTRRRRKDREDIPFGFPMFFKGTQAPVIRLYMSNTTITTAASTIYSTVFTVSASTLLNFSDFAACFDEYRVLRGEIQYVPFVTAANSTPSVSAQGFCVAVVDYANSGALASLSTALSHDTRRLFSLIVNARVKPAIAIERWPLQFEKLPDEEWISVSTTGTAFAYWKPFAGTIHGLGNNDVGYLMGWVDVQFRGQAN